MLWRTGDLPLQLSSGPFSVSFVGQKGDHAVTFYPGWVVLDCNGVAVASVARGVDATFIAEILNAKVKV